MEKFKKELNKVAADFAANGEKIGLIMINGKTKNDTVIGGIKIVYNEFVPEGKMIIVGDQTCKDMMKMKKDWSIPNPFRILK